jgi:hemerythrin-like domain-containing protein
VKATEVLQQEHRALLALFSAFEEARAAGAGDARHDVQRIRRECQVHLELEEALFYPALGGGRRRPRRTGVSAALAEHEEMEAELAALAQMDPDEDGFDERLRAVHDRLARHIASEEERIFKLAHRCLRAPQLEELGARMEERRRAANDRPTGEERPAGG